MQAQSIYERFDEYDLLTTVAVLDRINPHGITAEDIKVRVSMTYAYGSDEEKPSVLSTGGWVASNYRTHDGTIRWRVTVSPSVALAYLDRMGTN